MKVSDKVTVVDEKSKYNNTDGEITALPDATADPPVTDFTVKMDLDGAEEKFAEDKLSKVVTFRFAKAQMSLVLTCGNKKPAVSFTAGARICCWFC